MDDVLDLRSIGRAVITADALGNIAFMNPAAERLTGWQQQDALGRALVPFNPEEPLNLMSPMCVADSRSSTGLEQATV